MYSLAVFDLDGTLLDTLGDLHSSVNFALASSGFPLRSKQEVRGFIGNGVVKLMERSTPEGTDEEAQKQALSVFREHYLSHMSDTTVPFQGVRELLCHLRERGVKIAVVSNKLHSAVKELCASYFPGLIDMAVGVSEEGERKPSPVNVLRVMKAFAADPGQSIYIGDSEVDVQTAKNASIDCIGVTWGFRDRRELQAAGCAFVADTAEEAQRIILS